MGVVYQARQEALGRPVALKMIRGADPDLRERFLREARAVARLQHPNIVQVFEVGEAAGQPYCALEYVEGGSLDRKLDGTPRAPRQSAQMVEVLARAVQAAHEAGVVHRDLKPANVLVARGWVLKVTDFGLAKQIDDVGQTQTGAILGTPSYMAPEQAQGKRDVGPAADVYALGAILYELLTGRPPFRGATVLDTLEQVRSQEPVPVRQLQPKCPRDLELVCLKCLHKEPGRRYASAGQLADELGRYLAGEPLRHTRPVSRTERVVRWCRRKPALAGASALAVIFLVLGLVSTGIFVMQLSQTNEGLREQTTRAQTKEQEATEALTKFLAADERRKKLSRLSAGQYLERGLNLCEKEGPAHGLPWLANALLLAPPDAADLQARIRTNLADWGRAADRLVLRHTAPVTAGAFSADGRRVATGAADGSVQVWAVPGGQAVGQPIPFGRPVGALALNYDGGLLAAMDKAEGKVSLWDVGSGQKKIDLEHPSAPSSQALHFSPNGQTLAVCSLRGVFLYESRTGRRRSFEDNVLGGLRSVAAFSRDSQAVLLPVSNGEELQAEGLARLAQVRLQARELESGKAVGAMLPGSDVVAAAFSPDGNHLLTGGFQGGAQVWDRATGRPLGQRLAHAWQLGKAEVLPGADFQTTPFAQGILAVAFLDGGRTCLTVTTREAQRWDAATGRPTGLPVSYPASPVVVAAPDRRHLLLAGGGNEAVLWESPPPGGASSEGVYHEIPALAAGISADGKSLLTAAPAESGLEFKGEARLWSSETGKPIREPLAAGAAILAAAFRPDGKQVLLACADRTTRLWDAATGKPLGPPLEHPTPVTAVAFSRPDGRTFVTAERGNQTRWWDTASGDLLGFTSALGGYSGGVTQGVAFRPDGRALVTDGDSTYVVWSTETGKQLSTKAPQPFGPPGRRATTALSPDGKVVARLEAGEILVRDVDSATPLCTPLSLRGPDLVPFNSALTLRAGGTQLAAATTWSRSIPPGFRSEVSVWDLPAGTQPGPVISCEGMVEAVAISTDGKMVLAGMSDGKAHWWSIATGKQLGTVAGAAGPGGAVKVVLFSPDGKTFLTGIGRSTILSGAQVSGAEAALRDAGTGKPVGKALSLAAYAGFPILAPDGQTFLTAEHTDANNLAFRIREGATGSPLFETMIPRNTWEVMAVALRGGLRIVPPFIGCYSPDGKSIALPGEGGVHLQRLLDGKLLVRFPGPASLVAFRGDGKIVLTAGGGKARLWDAETGQPVGQPLAVEQDIVAAAVAQGHKVLLSTKQAGVPDSSGGTTQLWDILTGKAVTAPVTGRLLAINREATACITDTPLSGGSMLQPREVETLLPLGKPRSHRGPVLGVAFGADGREWFALSQVFDANPWDSSIGQGRVGGMDLRRWKVATPLEGDTERLAVWAQLVSGMDLDEKGAVRPLNPTEREKLQQRLAELGGPPPP
jgi:WD40 repeat protein